jgi:hypothetical protein
LEIFHLKLLKLREVFDLLSELFASLTLVRQYDTLYMLLIRRNSNFSDELNLTPTGNRRAVIEGPVYRMRRVNEQDLPAKVIDSVEEIAASQVTHGWQSLQINFYNQ